MQLFFTNQICDFPLLNFLPLSKEQINPHHQSERCLNLVHDFVQGKLGDPLYFLLDCIKTPLNLYQFYLRGINPINMIQ